MAVRNRVWDPQAGGFVTWKTQSSDTLGIEYPGPDSFANTSDFCVVRDTQQQGPVEAQLHDLTHDPVGLWQLNGDLLDSSGNGYDLSLAAGTSQYGPGSASGTRAAYFDRSTRYDSTSPAPAPLRILGDLTVELLCKPVGLTNDTFGDSLCFCSGTDNSGLEVDNFLWLIRLSNSLNNPELFWEDGAGGANNLVDTDFVVSPNRWHHIAMVRVNGGAGATTGQLYVDGFLVAQGTAFNEPTGATNAWVKLGGSTTGQSDYLGYMQSVKIIPSALTPAQILAEARRTLPLGLRP